MIEFNKEIKKILIDKEMKSQDLARLMGITRQALYSKMESKNITQKIEILEHLGYKIEMKIVEK